VSKMNNSTALARPVGVAVDPTVLPWDARVRHYIRIFAKGRLGHNASSLQRLAIRRAAQAEAEVDRLYSDPTSTPTDRTRALHAARLMHHRMEAALADARPPAREPTYHEVIAMAAPREAP
jgi:hypothetical protein